MDITFQVGIIMLRNSNFEIDMFIHMVTILKFLTISSLSIFLEIPKIYRYGVIHMSHMDKKNRIWLKKTYAPWSKSEALRPGV